MECISGERRRCKSSSYRLAHRHLGLIRDLDFCPVISGSNNDTPDYAPWTDRTKIKERIAAFKKPLVHDDPSKRSPIAFLIVKSMLLTGFDAPVEQVLYLDRSIKEAELLQAIARVNRTYGEKKRTGLVVDYCRENGIGAILRGLRTVSDFEAEYQLALTNRHLEPKIESVFVMPSAQYSYVSSSLIREIVRSGGDVSSFLPGLVEQRLRDRLSRS